MTSYGDHARVVQWRPASVDWGGSGADRTRLGAGSGVGPISVRSRCGFRASAADARVLLPLHVHQLPDMTVGVLEASAVHGALLEDRLPRPPASRDGLGDRLVDVLAAVG